MMYFSHGFLANSIETPEFILTQQKILLQSEDIEIAINIRNLQTPVSFTGGRIVSIKIINRPVLIITLA